MIYNFNTNAPASINVQPSTIVSFVKCIHIYIVHRIAEKYKVFLKYPTLGVKVFLEYYDTFGVKVFLKYPTLGIWNPKDRPP